MGYFGTRSGGNRRRRLIRRARMALSCNAKCFSGGVRRYMVPPDGADVPLMVSRGRPILPGEVSRGSGMAAVGVMTMATAWLLAAAPVAAAGPQVATPADVRTAAQDPVVEADAADPLTLEVAYVADVLHNAHGGIRRGTRYLDNLGVVATADLDRLAGIDRTRAMVYLLYNNGTRFSASLVGDAQVASGIETGVRATRVDQAWVEHRGADDDWSVRAGI